VDIDAYLALLRVQHGDKACVQAVFDADEVTSEQLERISATVVLNSDDVRQMLDAQVQADTEAPS
jgi:hypothetical protein